MRPVLIAEITDNEVIQRSRGTAGWTDPPPPLTDGALSFFPGAELQDPREKKLSLLKQNLGLVVKNSFNDRAAHRIGRKISKLKPELMAQAVEGLNELVG